MLLYYYHLTHNLKVAGSNPAPATNKDVPPSEAVFFGLRTLGFLQGNRPTPGDNDPDDCRDARQSA